MTRSERKEGFLSHWFLRKRRITPEEQMERYNKRLIGEALHVLHGELSAQEPNMSADPAYYDSFISTPASLRNYFLSKGQHYIIYGRDYIFDDEPVEGHSTLPVLWKRVGRLVGNDAQGAFTHMVMDMPELRPGRFVEGVWALALNDWNYTNDFAEKVRNPQGVLVSQQQWNMIGRQVPGIRGRATLEDHAQVLRAFSTVVAQDQSESGFAAYVKRQAKDDDTEEIKRRFMAWLDKRLLPSSN